MPRKRKPTAIEDLITEISSLADITSLTGKFEEQAKAEFKEYVQLSPDLARGELLTQKIQNHQKYIKKIQGRNIINPKWKFSSQDVIVTAANAEAFRVAKEVCSRLNCLSSKDKPYLLIINGPHKSGKTVLSDCVINSFLGSTIDGRIGLITTDSLIKRCHIFAQDSQAERHKKENRFNIYKNVALLVLENIAGSQALSPMEIEMLQELLNARAAHAKNVIVSCSWPLGEIYFRLSVLIVEAMKNFNVKIAALH